MDLELFKEGFLIMVIGMGTVFFFLVAMIYAMEINSKVLAFINKFIPEEIENTSTTPKKIIKKDDDAEIALAIACALNKGGSKC